MKRPILPAVAALGWWRSVLLPLTLLGLSAAAFPEPPAAPPATAHASQRVVLAGGCFWGVQAVFESVKGVTRTTAGFAGGDASTAQYETVSTGRTGHAESVEVVYDPKAISFGRLLQIFFEVAHDPTELDRQGPDSGTQYRSAIFTTSPAQQRVALAYIRELDRSHFFAHPIVTTVAPLRGFYAAEEYHQHFARLNPENPYIVYNDAPKVQHLRELFPSLVVR